MRARHFVAFVSVAALVGGCEQPGYEQISAASASLTWVSDGACPAGVERSLDGRGAYMDPSTFLLTEDGGRFHAALKGPDEDPNFYRRAWLSPTSLWLGTSFGYEVRGCIPECENPPPNSPDMQKVHHHFLYGDDMGVAFDQRRYIGFAVRASREPPEPGQWAMLFQMWQGSPHSPPLAGKLTTTMDGTQVLVVELRNDNTRSHPGAVPVVFTAIPNFEMDRWYSIVLSLYPEHTGIQHRAGNVTVGMDYYAGEATGGAYVQAFRYFGPWGYQPGNRCVYSNVCAAGQRCAGNHDLPTCDVEPPNDSMDFKFGIYREAQDTPLQARFDNIKLTRSYSEASPQYWCLGNNSP